ncbi:unnamed protein product [Closterium sp. Naga37s-1]|nr:unnamed protein product [Closterium sp. Naga37s-1]
MAARLAVSTAVAASFRQIQFFNVVASSHPAIAACEIASFRHALVTNAFAVRPPLVACAPLHRASPAVDSSHRNSNPIRSTSRRGDSGSSACSNERALPSARVFPVAPVSVSLRPSLLLDSPVKELDIPLALDAALGIPQAVVALPHCSASSASSAFRRSLASASPSLPPSTLRTSAHPANSLVLQVSPLPLLNHQRPRFSSSSPYPHSSGSSPSSPSSPSSASSPSSLFAWSATPAALSPSSASARAFSTSSAFPPPSPHSRGALTSRWAADRKRKKEASKKVRLAINALRERQWQAERRRAEQEGTWQGQGGGQGQGGRTGDSGTSSSVSSSGSDSGSSGGSDMRGMVGEWMARLQQLQHTSTSSSPSSSLSSAPAAPPPPPPPPPSAAAGSSVGSTVGGVEPLVGPLRPQSSDEASLASLLARSDLVVTRRVEWGNMLLGYEQSNQYAIVDAHTGEHVGAIVESSNWLMRQFLRAHRPFTASIHDAHGTLLLTVRRPMFFITSTIYVDLPGQKGIGQVHRRWHLWKRVYDAYLHKQQFARVVNPGFWWWSFALCDAEGQRLAEITRNWRGLGFEVFTDAGQYVVRFGSVRHWQQQQRDKQEQREREGREGEEEKVQQYHQPWFSTEADEGPVLSVARPLSLLERAVCLALAVSLDNDYFSRHRAVCVALAVSLDNDFSRHSALAGSAESGGKMSVSTSALYAIMFLCAAFVFSFLFRVLRALLLHAALLSPLPRRSDDPDSTIHVRTVLVIDGVPEGAPAHAGEGETGGAGGGTRGKGLRAEEIAQHSDLIRYSEVKEERRVEERDLVVVEIGERGEREQGWDSEKARAGTEGGSEAACEGEGQREADRETDAARAAAAVNGQGSEMAERRRDVDGSSERLVKTQHKKQETEEKGAGAARAAEAGGGGGAGGGAVGGGRTGGGRAGGGEEGEGGVEGVWGALAVECSVCLTEFKEEERVRRLHCCTHMFHQECIDGWLQAHTSCPLCLWAEEQADRGRERERALRERAARSRLAEALDPKLLGAFSDLVTYADVKLERDADARGSAPSSPSALTGLLTLADVTVAGGRLPGDDESCVGGGGSLQEDGTTVVVDIRGEGTGSGGSECSNRNDECRPATKGAVAGNCDQKNWGIEDGSSAVQVKEAAAAEGTESQEESAAGADSRALPSSYAPSIGLSPSGGKSQGPLPAEVLELQPEFAAVAGSGGTGGASEVAIPVIAVTATECSVCLVEFEDDAMLRRMHCCRHLFHQVSMGECWGMEGCWGMQQ